MTYEEFSMNLSSGQSDSVVAFTMQKLKVESSIEKALLLKELIGRNGKKPPAAKRKNKILAKLS